MKTLSLLLAVTLGVDGGVTADVHSIDPDVHSTVPAIYQACPEKVAVTEVDGGTLVPDQQGRRLNCLMDACETHRLQLETTIASSPPPPSWYYWAAGVVGAFALGMGTGIICSHIRGCLR